MNLQPELQAGWLASAPEAVAAIAYVLSAAALFSLFTGKRARPLGAVRWLVAAGLGVAGVLELAGLLAAQNGLSLAAQLYLLSSCCLLLTAAGLWPFLAHMNKSLAHSISRKLERQLVQAEAQAGEARHLLLQAEGVAHVGHWVYYIETGTLIWSDEIYRIHGRSKADFTPDVTTGIQAYHEDDREVVAAAFREVVAGKKASFDLALRIRRTDGTLRHVLVRSALQPDSGGKPCSVFGVIVDITEQKLIEEKLRNSNLRIEQTNKMLQELALVDSLTGLPNRRHFDATLESEFRRAVRDGSSLGLIMIDLDRFKNYNDLYGHPAGDECLRKVASAIAEIPNRPADLVARYGGEEIVVLLPGTTKMGAEMIAHRLTSAVRNLELPHKGNNEKFVTISCGVAVFNHAADALLPMNLVEHADQALYEAKLTGRNRVGSYAERSLTTH